MNALTIDIPIVSAAWLATHIDHPNLLILDGTIKKAVSDTPPEFSGKRIKNALFFDLKGIFSDQSSSLPNTLLAPEAFTNVCQELGIRADHTIIVYDQLGIYSSARVWWMFYAMGHTNVAILDGGLPIWKESGFALETVPQKPPNLPKGNFEANYDIRSKADTKDILQLLDDPDTLLLDARSKGRFYGTTPEPRGDLKSGHIPNSTSLPYTEVLENGKMKSISELKRVFQNFDIGNKKLIFSCGSGITACIILLAAKLCGYENLTVYDGSWTEWGQLDGVPIQC